MKKSTVLADLVFAAGCDAPVLITHRSDVSRETYARFIHEHSRLRADPFVAILCGGDVSTGPMAALLRMTLERVRRGTLFLDGISDLDALTQTELVAFLADDASAPSLAGQLPSPRLRLIAGSGEPLRPKVAAGRFSAALFSRLAVIQITGGLSRHEVKGFS